MQVITVPNILEPTKSFKTEHDYTSVIDYLQFQYPDGFKVPHVIYLNDKRLEVVDYDKECGRNDYVVIAFSAGIPLAGLAGWQLFAAYVANFAISAAVSYAIGEIFKPDIPKGVLTSDQKTDAANVSSVYNLSSGQNRISLGQPIPSLYGRTRVYPSLVEQPYFRFKDNEMYLYQMMAISVGDVAIEELFISESKETDLAPDDILSKTYRNDSFDTGVVKSDISTTFNDDNYHMRVNTLPEVSGLELRGTPGKSEMFVAFSGSIITFHDYGDNDYPDLSSLTAGSKIIISDATESNNNGEFTVASSDNSAHTVTVQGHTFTIEPSDTTVYDFTAKRCGEDDTESLPIFQNRIYQCSDTSLYDHVTLGNVYTILYQGNMHLAKKASSYLANAGYGSNYVEFTGGSNGALQGSGDTSIPFSVQTVSSVINAEFQTSYGAYTLEDTPSSMNSIEVDVEFPRGIYDSNIEAGGVFEDRTILLEYKLIGSLETLWLDLNDNSKTYTEIERTNTPQRRTYNLPIPDGLTDDTPLKIRLRRSSPEVEDNYSQDQAIVTRIKSIYNEPDINDYGDITLLWVRAKATNAISSAGQFQINAWVNRVDVKHDLSSVIADVYTNTEYGAGLSAADLDLPTMNAPQYDVVSSDTGFLEVNTTPGEETYYGEDTSGLPCPPGSVKTAIFFDGVNVFGSECIGDVELEGSYIPNVNYLAPDGWYYMIEEYIEFIDFAYTKVRVRRYELIDIIDPIYAEFNGALDSKITVMDAIRMIGKAGRYTVYLDGQNVKMRKDEVQLIRTALFNETNILKNSFKLDYLFGEDDGYDGMSVKYRSSTDFKEAIATYPETSINSEITELIGCTDFDIALSEATYGWLQKESRRKVATFSTDIQGIIPNYLDRIGITHNVPDWGLSGQITTVDENQITISCQLFRFSDELGKCDDEFGDCSDIFCEIEPENIDYNTIIFRKNDGSVSDLYTFTIINEYNILLNETPPTWLYTGYDYDNTFFSIGESSTFIKDYIVTEISPRGNNVVDVKCINYDDSVYEAPYLVDGAGDNLTDGSGNYLTV